MSDNMDKNELYIPYYAHEGMLARNERIIKRLIIALIVSVGLIFASNALWLWSWSQYDYESTDQFEHVKVNAEDGIANYIGNDGSINNGEYNGNKDNQKTKTNLQEKK